jgi:hypothetical protein
MQQYPFLPSISQNRLNDFSLLDLEDSDTLKALLSRFTHSFPLFVYVDDRYNEDTLDNESTVMK